MENVIAWIGAISGVAGSVIAVLAYQASRQATKIAKDASEYVSFDCRPTGNGTTFRLKNTGNVRVSPYSITFDEINPRWLHHIKSSPLDPGQAVEEQILDVGSHGPWTVNDSQLIEVTFYRGDYGQGQMETWTGSVQPHGE